MRSPAVLKTIALSAFAVLSVPMLAWSIADGTPDSSENPLSSAISETSFPAPTTAGNKRIPSSAKRSRAAAKPYLAAVAPIDPPQTTLLAAVHHDDITPHHQALADAALRALPSPCRDNLKNFHVLYTNVKQRGLGGKTTIIIDGTPPDAEFVGLLVHECGHVTHGNLQGNPGAGESAYRDGKNPIYEDSVLVSFFSISWMTEGVLRQGAAKADFVSGYAKSDAFEDFAETYAMYVLHRPAMRERARSNPAIAAKLAWMETNLPLAENPLGESSYAWDKQVPWDVTRLPYKLAAADL